MTERWIAGRTRYTDDQIITALRLRGSQRGAYCLLRGDEHIRKVPGYFGARCTALRARALATVPRESAAPRDVHEGEPSRPIRDSGIENAAPSCAKGRATEEATPDRFLRLVDACRTGIDFSALCDRLDLSPTRCSRLLDDARAHGIQVDVAHSTVALHWQEPSETVADVAPLPAVGETYRCAVISDTHAGSRYAMRGQLADFVRHAYAEGCREVLHAGDLLDGCYRHGEFELTHSGLADQARDLAETLPRLSGLSYHAITGNHDGTFAERTGLDVGQAITGAWHSLGRDDLTCYGDRGAYLRVGGVVVHDWHPKKSGAYALSYLLQKQVERYAALKPQILLAGHWHTFCHVCVRGVEAIAVPCFQGGESAFAKSLGARPRSVG